MKGILLTFSVITALLLIPVEAPLSRESRGFDVFLNFRGPDSRHTVVNILYKTLTDAGFRVFLDDEHIQKGEVIEEELWEAIINSRIYIPILSKDYASSKWCLRELAMMIDLWNRSIGQQKRANLDCWERSIAQEGREILDCWNRSIGQQKKVILPIFDGVSVSEDVKLRSEVYTSALQKHKKKVDEAVLKQWEDALRVVATIDGWNLQDHGLSELANLIKKRVLKHMNANDAIASGPDRLAGIEDRTEHIRVKLQPISHCINENEDRTEDIAPKLQPVSYCIKEKEDRERSTAQEKEVILDCWKRSIDQEKKVILDCWDRSIGQAKKVILPISDHVDTSVLQKLVEAVGGCALQLMEFARSRVLTRWTLGGMEKVFFFSLFFFPAALPMSTNLLDVDVVT